MADSHLLEDEAAAGIPGVIEVEADSSGLQAFNRSRAATETTQNSGIRAEQGVRCAQITCGLLYGASHFCSTILLQSRLFVKHKC